MPFPEDAFSELNRVCLSLGRSVDSRYLPEELHDLSIRDIHVFQKAVEYIKQPLSATRVKRNRHNPHYLQSLLQEFSERLDQVRADKTLDRITRQVAFRLIGSRIHRAGEPVLHDALLYRNVTLEEAMRLLEESVSAISLDLLTSEEFPQSEDTSARPSLSRVLPREQVPAPAQFRLSDGRLEIAHQLALADDRDERNIESSRKELLERGQQILEGLRTSNCDPRLVAGAQELQERISSGEDIIRTGITNITCNHLFEKCRGEIPDALYGLMQGHSVSVNMYVGQFPEWRRFAEQAATASLEPEHFPHISSAAIRIADELNAQPDLADPEVPRLLRLLAELVSDPKKAGRRAAFAVLRTIENLVLSVYSSINDLLSKTSSKVTEGLSTALSKVVIIAVSGAILLGPVAGAIPEVSVGSPGTELEFAL